MYTGENDVSQAAVIKQWNHKDNIPYYPSHCGMLNGSFGEGWPPKRARDSISLFAVDLCRLVA